MADSLLTYPLVSPQRAVVLPTQLETLPGNFSAQEFQSLFLVVCVMYKE